MNKIDVSDLYAIVIEVPPTDYNLVALNSIYNVLMYNGAHFGCLEYNLIPDTGGVINNNVYCVSLKRPNSIYFATHYLYLKEIINLLDEFKPIGATLYIANLDIIKRQVFMYCSNSIGADKMIAAIDEDSDDMTILNLFVYITELDIFIDKQLVSQILNQWKQKGISKRNKGSN